MALHGYPPHIGGRPPQEGGPHPVGAISYGLPILQEALEDATWDAAVGYPEAMRKGLLQGALFATTLVPKDLEADIQA